MGGKKKFYKKGAPPPPPPRLTGLRHHGGVDLGVDGAHGGRQQRVGEAP